MGQSAYPNFNQFEILQVGISSVHITSSTTNWATVPHNLGYAPTPVSYLNDVTLNGISDVGNIPLPTYTSAFFDLTNKSIEFSTWLLGLTDETNFYFVAYNATGLDQGTFSCKYYLLRERANQ